MASDDELLTAWRAGDGAAGEQLFDRYFAALTRFFRNKVHDRADDLIQQTVLGLLEAKDNFRGEGTFRSFVFGVAYNVLRSHCRGQLRDAERFDDAVTTLGDLGASPAELLADKREQRLLLSALRRIPVQHQVLLELYFWEPLGAKEIAAVLGVPEGTVRTRLRRAKTLVGEQIEQLSSDPGLVHSTISDLDDWARSIRKAR